MSINSEKNIPERDPYLRQIKLAVREPVSPDRIYFDIADEVGQNFGYAYLAMDPFDTDQIYIENIDIGHVSDWTHKNMGYGNLVYEELAKVISAMGKRFVSSRAANDYALSKWEHLVEIGVAKRDESKTRNDLALYYTGPEKKL